MSLTLRVGVTGIFGLIGGPDLGHLASVHVDYHQNREVCSTGSPSLPRSAVDLICLSLNSVPTF